MIKIIKNIPWFFFGLIVGMVISLFFLTLALDSINENTITFQTDSPWFNDCKGKEYGEFIFTFGTLDCEDLGLENFERVSNGN